MRPSSRARRPASRPARNFVALLLATSTIAGPIPAPAQAPETAPGPPLTESMEVVLVNVEGWVYDKDDIPVRGLTANDFEVLEDGVPVPISHFAEIQDRPAAARRLPPIVPPTQAPESAPAPATEEPATLVAYFDQLH